MMSFVQLLLGTVQSAQETVHQSLITILQPFSSKNLLKSNLFDFLRYDFGGPRSTPFGMWMSWGQEPIRTKWNNYSKKSHQECTLFQWVSNKSTVGRSVFSCLFGGDFNHCEITTVENPTAEPRTAPLSKLPKDLPGESAYRRGSARLTMGGSTCLFWPVDGRETMFLSFKMGQWDV